MFWLAYKRKDSSNEAFPFILEVTCLSHSIFKLIKKKPKQKKHGNTELQQILRIYITLVLQIQTLLWKNLSWI